MVRRGIAAVALVGLLAAACGDDDGGTAAGEAGTTEAADAPSGAEDTGGSGDAVAPAEWQTIEVTDADGESFTIADLAGRPVLVETFATWCGNCRRQLGDTDRAAEEAGDDAVFVALSVETELDADDMADYAEANDFDHIRFAVMSPAMLGAVSDAFGTSALNPPSTPKVAVDADGRAGDLVTGFESPEDILASLGLS